MRNLKKILALVLALVMSLSLVTIANAVDFTDDDDIDYEEAVDVMSTIGVIEGFENSDGSYSYDPDSILTREQAAKLITYMLMGENAEKLGIESSSFNDVATTRWSAPSIEYCVSLGIIDGDGEGNFYPAGQLTGYAFAKMLLTALGYDSKIEGFTGSSWSINVATLAMEVGLDNGLEGGITSAYLSRQEAAQMALNAIQTPLVTYDKQASITVNGAEVSIGAAEAKYVTTTLAREQRISTQTLSNSGEYTVEFGEKYFPKLELKADTDPFCRPSYTWIYDGSEIGTYIDDDLLLAEYTTTVKGSELYELLGKAVVDDYEITVAMDGKVQPVSVVNQIVKTNKTDFTVSGRGALLQVFLDNEEKEVDITVINTYLAQAEADYNDKSETASFTIWGLTKSVVGSVTEYTKTKTAGAEDKATSVKVSNDDVYVADIVDDQYVLITVAQGEVRSVEDVDIVADATITAFSLGRNITADGEKYDYATTAEYDYEVLDAYSDTNMKEQTYNIYLDPYGNLIGLDIVEAINNYVFITGIESLAGSNLEKVNYEAFGIFMDGQGKKIDVKAATGTVLTSGNSVNRWYTYSESDGVYTLTEVGNNQVANYKVAQGVVADEYNGDTDYSFTIDYAHTSLPITSETNYTSNAQRVYGNNDSVYMTAKVGLVDVNGPAYDQVVITGASNVVTGVKNTSIVTYSKDDRTEVSDAKGVIGTDLQIAHAAYVLFKSNGYVIAAVVVGADSAISSNIAFASSSQPSLEGYDSNTGLWTWERKVIIDGEEVVLKETSSDGTGLTYLSAAAMDQYKWYKVSYNADGFVTNSTEINADIPSSKLGYVNVYTGGAIQNKIDTIGIDTVIYEQTFTNVLTANLPTLIEQTLYLSTTDADGFFIAEDAKVVFIQMSNGSTTTDYSTGPAAVEAAISSLISDGATTPHYTYSVNAVIEDGAAKVVIIEDTDNGTPGSGNHTGSGLRTVTSVAYTAANDVIQLNLNGNDTAGATYQFTLRIMTAGGYQTVGTFNAVVYNADLDAARINLSTNLAAGQTYEVLVDGLTPYTFVAANP